jgi:hypothetical protein
MLPLFARRSPSYVVPPKELILCIPVRSRVREEPEQTITSEADVVGVHVPFLNLIHRRQLFDEFQWEECLNDS